VIVDPLERFFLWVADRIGMFDGMRSVAKRSDLVPVVLHMVLGRCPLCGNSATAHTYARLASATSEESRKLAEAAIARSDFSDAMKIEEYGPQADLWEAGALFCPSAGRASLAFMILRAAWNENSQLLEYRELDKGSTERLRSALLAAGRREFQL
jgi:hypothetical protein